MAVLGQPGCCKVGAVLSLRDAHISRWRYACVQKLTSDSFWVGIGLALTYQALGAFYRRAIYKIITDTDANSFTNAPRLYVKAGFSTFCQQDIYQKQVRSGRDLIKQTMGPA